MIAWHWHLRHARGYRELGCLNEAQSALSEIPSDHAGDAEVLAEIAALAQERKDWLQLELTAERWARNYPAEPGAWIMWAYGARRAKSLEVAERVLMEALLHHPNEGTVHFNLGCYACQRGDLVQAQRRVVKAIAIDGQFRSLAESDPDLEPLRSGGLLKT